MPSDLSCPWNHVLIAQYVEPLLIALVPALVNCISVLFVILGNKLCLLQPYHGECANVVEDGGIAPPKLSCMWGEAEQE